MTTRITKMVYNVCLSEINPLFLASPKMGIGKKCKSVDLDQTSPNVVSDQVYTVCTEHSFIYIYI